MWKERLRREENLRRQATYRLLSEEAIPPTKEDLSLFRPQEIISLLNSVSTSYIYQIAKALSTRPNPYHILKTLFPPDHPDAHLVLPFLINHNQVKLFKTFYEEGYPRTDSLIHVAAGAPNLKIFTYLIKRGWSYRTRDEWEGKYPMVILLNHPKQFLIASYFLIHHTQQSPKVIKDLRAVVEFLAQDPVWEVKVALAHLLTHMEEGETWQEALLKPSLPPSLYSYFGHPKVSKIKRLNKSYARLLAKAVLSPIDLSLEGKSRKEKKEIIKLAYADRDPLWRKSVKEASKLPTLEEVYHQALFNYAQHHLSFDPTSLIQNIQTHYPHLTMAFLRWLPTLRVAPYLRPILKEWFTLPPEEYRKKRYQGIPYKEWKENHSQVVEVSLPAEKYQKIKKILEKRLPESLHESILEEKHPVNIPLSKELRPYVELFYMAHVPEKKVIFEITDDLDLLFMMGKMDKVGVKTCKASDSDIIEGKIGAVTNIVKGGYKIAVIRKGREILARRGLWLAESEKGPGIIKEPFYGHPGYRIILDHLLHQTLKKWKWVKWIDEKGVDVILLGKERVPVYVDVPVNYVKGLIKHGFS